MALLDTPALPVCDLIPAAPASVRVRFPFDLRLESLRRSIASIPGADELLLAMLNQFGALMAPFAPILVLAALVLTLVDCFTALPDAITSLSPQPIYDCLDALAENLPLLLQFVPGVPYLIMIRDIMQVVDQFILELIATLETLKVAVQKQIAALDFAESINDLTIVAYVECAAEDVRQQAVNITASLSIFETLLCILALPFAILEAFLPGDAKAAIKNVRCSIGDLLDATVPAAVPGDPRTFLNALIAFITATEAALQAFQVALRALLEILSRLIGEAREFVVGPPACFDDCP